MILVFGQTGQVATELRKQDKRVVALGRDQADLTDPRACRDAILARKPDMVINAAAYTAVDQAETDEDTAKLINGDAPTAMAAACAELGIPFVHISTDYVFDGEGTQAFAPTDTTGPLGAYGRTKRLGEIGVETSSAPYVIVRTSWVFSAHGSNFLKTMLRLGASHDSLTIVADQIGGPTSAASLAHACLVMANALKKDPKLAGIYHFSGQDDVSWADFAREIFSQAGIASTVKDIPTTDFPTPAPRPKNSRLNCQTLDVFGLNRPMWRDDVTTVLSELGVTK